MVKRVIGNPYDIEIPDKRTKFGGEKKHVTFRVPLELIQFVDALAEERGWQLSELIVYILDHFAQAEVARKEGASLFATKAASVAKAASPNPVTVAPRPRAPKATAKPTHYTRRGNKAKGAV